MSGDQFEPTRQEVLALYGEAMIAVQRFEQAMIDLLGARKELPLRGDTDPSSEEEDELERFWEKLFTWPAGQLRSALKLPPAVDVEIGEAVEARNLLAHHYLRDHEAELQGPSGRTEMASTLHSAAERFQALMAGLEAERLSLMHDADRTDDHINIASEVRRMRYYDPALDDSVPPEPFSDG
jgi:hypothetical protein